MFLFSCLKTSKKKLTMNFSIVYIIDVQTATSVYKIFLFKLFFFLSKATLNTIKIDRFENKNFLNFIKDFNQEN